MRKRKSATNRAYSWGMRGIRGSLGFDGPPWRNACL